MWRAPAVRPLEAMDPGRQRFANYGELQPKAGGTLASGG